MVEANTLIELRLPEITDFSTAICIAPPAVNVCTVVLREEGGGSRVAEIWKRDCARVGSDKLSPMIIDN